MRVATKPTFVALALLAMASAALAEPRDSRFRVALRCPERGSSTSFCVPGTVPSGVTLTLVTKDQAVPATAREAFKDANLLDNIDTFTRVEASHALPERTAVLAVLLAPAAIKPVPQIDIQDGGIAERLKRQVAPELQDFTLWCVDRGHKCRLQPRLIRLSPSVVVAEVNYSSDHDIFFQKTFLVGTQIIDLHKRSLGPWDIDRDCTRLDLAFIVSGRLHAATSRYTCEGDTRVRTH
jgi:hypothetical protein